MGEKERGKPDPAPEPQLQPSTSSSSSTTPSMPICSMANHTPSPINGLVVRPNSNGKPEDPARPVVVAHGWQTAWRFIYEKWRLCAFIALAVVVSRFSTLGWNVIFFFRDFTFSGFVHAVFWLCVFFFFPFSRSLYVHYRCFNKGPSNLLLPTTISPHPPRLTHSSVLRIISNSRWRSFSIRRISQTQHHPPPLSPPSHLPKF